MSKQKLKHWWLMFTVCILPMILTACGSELSAEEKAAKAAAKAQSGALMLLCFNVIVCIIITLWIIQLKNSAQLGTNAVTRFVRKGYSRGRQKQIYGALALLLVFDVLNLFLKFHSIKIFAILPPIGDIAFIIMNMKQHREDKQRIKDSRVVTKGALQAGSGVAKGAVIVAGAAAAPATGGASLGAAVAATAAIGASGAIMDQAAKNMEVEGFKGIDSNAVTEGVVSGASAMLKPGLDSSHIAQIADTDLFRQKALRLGCNEQMSLGEMAEVVLKYAPEASLKELPEGLSVEDKAVALLGAFKTQAKKVVSEQASVVKEQVKQVAVEKAQQVVTSKVKNRLQMPAQQSTDNVVVDAEFREVES